MNYYYRKAPRRATILALRIRKHLSCRRSRASKNRVRTGLAQGWVPRGRHRMATRRVAGGCARSARPPVNVRGRGTDPGGRRGSIPSAVKSLRDRCRGRRIGRVRGSGGLALCARPPVTLRDAIRRRKTYKNAPHAVIVSRSSRRARPGCPRGLGHNRADSCSRTAPAHQPVRHRGRGAGQRHLRCLRRQT